MGRDFDGSGDDLSRSGSPPVTVPPYTLIASFYIATGTASNRVILSLGDSGDSNDDYFYISANCTGDVARFFLKDLESSTTEQTIETVATFSRDKWQHIACTNAGHTSAKVVFLNGGNKVSNTATTSPDGIDNVKIGVTADSTPAARLIGRAGEVAIYDVVLADALIAALADGASPQEIKRGNLVAHWPLDGSGSPEPDLSGNAHHLTVNGDPTLTTHPPIVTPYGLGIQGVHVGAGAMALARPTNRFVHSRIHGRVA